MKIKSVLFLYKKCSFLITWENNTTTLLNVLNMPSGVQAFKFLGINPEIKKDILLNPVEIGLFKRLYPDEVVKVAEIKPKQGFFARLFGKK